MVESNADQLIADYGRAAKQAAGGLVKAPGKAVNAAIAGMAERLGSQRAEIMAANQQDLAAADQAGLSGGVRDRLALTDDRIAGMAAQLRLLADVPFPPRDTPIRELDGGLRLIERRRPVGVIGATYEARPNVTVDVASQLIKSRNAGVLRTGAAALTSALALHRLVITPALADAGLDPAAIQLVAEGDREYATALVRQPGLIPLVIVRGSGDTTRALAAEAARHGVRTLAHADGGGVLYLHPSADLDRAVRLLETGLDRLGVCNRVNLVLVAAELYDRALPRLTETLARLGVRASLPPHDHPLGYEWALDKEREATVTIAKVDSVAEALAIANDQTSAIAATVVAESPDGAAEFLDGYVGTGAFWNATTRLLDGFRLLQVPETGINVDRFPGPRGPVTFHDLYLRQYVVMP
ncbi:MAG TPA: aldehyde dehydrogenase family protein [Natronosporangium sp.]